MKWLRQFVSLTYVVKESPVQNDATMDDLRRAGLITEDGGYVTLTGAGFAYTGAELGLPVPGAAAP